MGLLFLIEVARYVLGIKNRKLVTFLQYITKRVSQLVLCSIVMQNIHIYFMRFQSCLLILVPLHSETVEIFCLNPAILIAGRSCHLCFAYSKLDFFQDKHGILQQINLMFIKQAKKKLVSGLVIQIISPKVLQESTTILQLKVYIVSVMKNKLGTHLSRSVLLIWLHSFSHLPGMQDLWIISFFFFFP